MGSLLETGQERQSSGRGSEVAWANSLSLPGEGFWAGPTGRRPGGRPKIHWRDSADPGLPWKELDKVAGEMKSWLLCLSTAQLSSRMWMHR